MTGASERLRSGLDALARAWWRVRWARRLARVAAAVAVGLTIWAAVDWWRPLGRAGLLASGALVAAGVAAALVWLARVWRRRPAPERMAQLVEEQCPEIDAAVSAALDPGTAASPFRELVVSDAADAVGRLETSRIVDPDDRRRAWLAAGATLAALAIASTASAPVMSRSARTWQFTVAPPQVSLDVAPGDRRVVRGSALQIQARVRGVPAGVPYAEPRLVVRGDGDVAAGAFVRQADGAFLIEVPSVTRDFTYHVEAGPLVSETYTVAALDRPTVERVDLSYVYPSFSGLEPRDEQDSGDIYAPAGTRVTVTVAASKPLQSARLVPTDGDVADAPLPLEIVGERRGQVSFDVKADGAYRIALVDNDALDSTGETEYFVRVMDDRPPEVRILRPAGDRGATRLEEVTIEARAEDDYGVQRLELVYAVRGGEEKVVPLGGDNSTVAAGRHTLYLEDLDVQPGDFITYHARARDIGRGKRPTEARSDIFFLEVRPTAQEFLAAQSSGGMNMAGGDADDLIAAQKDVVVATWKLERRSTGGRSAGDIRAVADAQEAVRAKAEAQASQGMMTTRPRRRRGGPAVEEAPEPLLEAVAAMQRATDELRGLRTAEAIPHEMEALNQLLRAQAEIRRRQIARQQGGGGGGGRQGNEDLSALFDRELLRQQGSEYEPRSNVESRAENVRENPALDRIRDLARRQDDLAREQQALAREQHQLPAEEVKRRLERLTREQERLRQEARQLSQQLQGRESASADQSQEGRQGQQGQQGQQAQGQESSQGQQAQAGQAGQPQGGQRQGGGTSGAAASGERMAEAAREMEAAASGLQNASPEEAAASGARSLQSLRDAERALQGALPDERRRAAGDVQLEARALAEAQRKLAAGTDQLAEDGAAGGRDEQRRRLAGEQGRVAERIARLERQVRELARGAGTPEEPLAEAAAELARRRLGQRLQEAAESLRDGGSTEDGSSPDALAQAQRDAAGVLDRVARLAGEATGNRDDSGALAGQLADAREVRDRLRDLETRIEAAARQAEAGAAESRADASGNRGEGKGDGQGTGGAGDAAAELQRLQQEYQRELRNAQELLARGGGSGVDRGGRLTTPEGQEFSRSAPGTEAFKQDFARWSSLKEGIASLLDRYEAGLARQLAEREAAERVTTPLKDEVPDRYSESVIRYYRSLSRRPDTR